MTIIPSLKRFLKVVSFHVGFREAHLFDDVCGLWRFEDLQHWPIMARLVAIAVVLCLCFSGFMEAAPQAKGKRDYSDSVYDERTYDRRNDVERSDDNLHVFDKSKTTNTDNDYPLSERYEISQTHPYPPVPHPAESNDETTERPLPPFAFQEEADVVAADSDTDETYTTLTTTTTTEVPSTTTTRPLTTTSYYENTSGPEDFDNGILPSGEEVDYHEYGLISDNMDTATRRTYSTLSSMDGESGSDDEAIAVRDDDTGDTVQPATEAPFDVTKSLMDAMNHQSWQGPRRWSAKMAVKTTTPYGLQDSDATIHPTLVPKWDEDEEGDEQTITSDYTTEMDAEHWDRVWPREKLKPWERQRPENMEGRVTVPKPEEENENNSIQEDAKEGEYLPPSFTKKIMYPMSTIYQVPVPPLTSFVMVPAGQLYYGDQAASLQHNRDQITVNREHQNMEDITAPQSGNAGESIPAGGIHAGGQKKIVRENTVVIEDVVEGSDLARSPQYELFKAASRKTAANKAFGIKNYQPPKVETADAESFLLSPVTIFDIPMPSVLKTALTVQANGYAARQYAAKNAQTVLKMDESGSPLKYRREKTTQAPVAELSDIDVIFGGSDDDDFKVEAYIDESLEAAQEAVCSRRSLQRLRPNMTPGSDVLGACFFAAEDCILVDTAPLERRINMNLIECASFCAENSQCKSISYSVVLSLCDIFGVLNGTHNTKLLQYKGYVYLQPIRPNLMNCLKTRRIYAAPTNSMINRINVNKVAPATTQMPMSERRVNPGARTSPCPPNNDIILFKSDHYRLRELGLPHYSQNCSENECIFSCLIDLVDGRKPFSCAATNYNIDTGDCKLYPAGGNVKGNGHIVEDDRFTHYEKACARKDFVDHCRGFPIDRFTQKTLVGFTIFARTAASLLDCVSLCFQRFTERGDCLSVTYFYSVSMHNCVLNSESHLTAAPYFVDEVEETADYASLDRCVMEVDESAEHEATPQVTDVRDTTDSSESRTDDNDISSLSTPGEDPDDAVIVSGDSELDPDAEAFFNDVKRRSINRQNVLKKRLKQSIRRIRRV
uniref:Apple domain-containing protein n=1 Tax=Panagrellus redivivus TaxID=6233 RepID=A0A7E4UQD5_PANRE